MRVRFVAPTSTSRAPAAAMISGMRKEPPISISSPRDTTTSRSFARAASAMTRAAALLFTARPASAPVSAVSRRSARRLRWPRRPVARSISRSQ
jgi:hypothetical protein